MIVYFHLHSGLYLAFCRYEGWRGENVCVVDCICTESMCAGLPVCDLDLGLVVPFFSPQPPRFWYLLSLIPIRVYIPNYIVVCTLGCVGMNGGG